jgi:hypothetical protein
MLERKVDLMAVTIPVICTSCGNNFNVSNPTKSINKLREYFFWTSNGVAYKENEGRLTICKDCVEKLYNDVNAELKSTADTFYYMCSIFDWYYNQKIFDIVEEKAVEDNIEGFPIGMYFSKLNAGKKNADGINGNNRDKTFLDTIREGAKRPSEMSTPSGKQRKRYSEKWMGDYTDHDIKYLDNYYDGLCRDYKIVTENHRDYAKKIAKASLHMDNCSDNMMHGVKDADILYTKACDTFDRLSKSAKFAEQTRSSNEIGLSNFGKIFEQVEKGKYIYKHTPIESDDVDKLLDYFQTIDKSL